MVEITINNDMTIIRINGVDILIQGEFEIKKKTPVTGTTDVNNPSINAGAVILNGTIDSRF